MSKIFCLETEWTQDESALLNSSSAQPLLAFLKNCKTIEIDYCFRHVATRSDFEYYIDFLRYEDYDDCNIVYLCFHGEDGKIVFANKQTKTLNSFSYYEKNVFKKRYVHFDSCETLNKPIKELRTFKRETGARVLSGFKKEVGYASSFLFEIWLFTTIHENPGITAREINQLAMEQMPYYVKDLGFKAY